ncbi:MAG TPA: hypothetical protein VHV78_05600 [Gemmatimonadaceae bacterium]|jgi:hypothetical protein|nr:hypothetical protein [Gemmatimonadaceae bacterium]
MNIARTFPRPIRRHPWISALVAVIAAPVIGIALWTEIALHYTYSSGERAGYLQKVSKRGWVCKTWEGELQLVAVPGSMPEKFVFTARSDSLAEALNHLNGQRVVLSYAQHVGVPSSCFGDTEYYVTGVRLVGGT